MAPNSDNNAFLAMCFKNMKERPKIDFTKVSLRTGYTVGGCRNKFRDIMRKLEIPEDEGGEISADDLEKEHKPRTVRGKMVPNKVKPTDNVDADANNAAGEANEVKEGEAVDKNDDKDSESDSGEPAAKRRKATNVVINKKSVAKAKELVDDADDSGEETEKPTPLPVKKRAPRASRAKKPATAAKAKADTDTDTVGENVDEEAKTLTAKPITKGRGRPTKADKEKAIKQLNTANVTASQEGEDNVAVDTNAEMDVNNEVEVTAIKPKDKPTPAPATKRRAAPTKTNKVKSGASTVATTKPEVKVIIPVLVNKSSTAQPKKTSYLGTTLGNSDAASGEDGDEMEVDGPTTSDIEELTDGEEV